MRSHRRPKTLTTSGNGVRGVIDIEIRTCCVFVFELWRFHVFAETANEEIENREKERTARRKGERNEKERVRRRGFKQRRF